MNKLRSWKSWLATLTLTAFILKTYCKIEIQDWDTLVNLIMLLGAAWGIWSDVTPKGE